MRQTLERLLTDALEDPRHAAVLGALGGAAKGAVLGLALGKLAVGIGVGAAAGAGTALLLRAGARRQLAAKGFR